MNKLSELLISVSSLVFCAGLGAACQAQPTTPGSTPAGKPAAAAPAVIPSAKPEVRGTWVTTTGNEAIANASNTAASMKQLREIGLNTVFVETWKNGYTQYPSKVLKSVIGLDRRPALMPQDPGDKPEAALSPGRDLLGETLIEAHRNGLIYVGWFEYGFMAAHKSTDNHLRRMKKEWLSLDKDGGEVAPNGFVWMNPLHPEARRFLIDLIVEAVDAYDMDGIQLDDRIVWPYKTMGYDKYTLEVYARENNGKKPPTDEKSPEWAGWMRWRADKVNEFSKIFVQEVRAARPGLLISLSPAVYPWCYENYCLEWPKWGAWTSADKLTSAIGTAPKAGGGAWAGTAMAPHWDEFIPQNYRFSYKDFEKTWLDQIKHVNAMGNGRVSDLLAGIRVVGEGPDCTWEDLVKSMDLCRSTGSGGHVHWFSRGVLDVYPKELTGYYNVAQAGPAPHPFFPASWRPGSIALARQGSAWRYTDLGPGRYRVIYKLEAVQGKADSGVWQYGEGFDVAAGKGSGEAKVPAGAVAAELLVDRRPEMKTVRQRRAGK